MQVILINKEETHLTEIEKRNILAGYIMIKNGETKAQFIFKSKKKTYLLSENNNGTYTVEITQNQFDATFNKMVTNKHVAHIKIRE